MEAADKPLDVPKEVAPDVWIVDGAPVRAMGLPLPVRMTVLRLGGGDLLLHSPTRYDDRLRRALERLGRVRHLMASNSGHWMFLPDWQRRCPDALTWAAPGLRERRPVKKAGLRVDHDLGPAPPADWAGDIEQVIVPGGFGFAEVAFFHRASRTLVLTDLVLNLEPAKLPALARPLLRLTGTTAPNGRAPVYLRWVIGMKRKEAARAAAQLVAWDPERVIFAHGRWFERDGAAALRRSLAWLLPG
jgi:Domain of unknown function (DUF4336)